MSRLRVDPLVLSIVEYTCNLLDRAIDICIVVEDHTFTAAVCNTFFLMYLCSFQSTCIDVYLVFHHGPIYAMFHNNSYYARCAKL